MTTPQQADSPPTSHRTTAARRKQVTLDVSSYVPRLYNYQLSQPSLEPKNYFAYQLNVIAQKASITFPIDACLNFLSFTALTRYEYPAAAG